MPVSESLEQTTATCQSQPEASVDSERQRLSTFRADVLSGLLAERKTLPCKYLYDEDGSRLFDDICDVPEYYVTRTELAILRDSLDEIVCGIGKGGVLVEPGAGSGLKTRLLLEHAAPAAYVPVDISGDYLQSVAASLAADFPTLEIEPVAADFTSPFVIPATAAADRVLYFPGSTIGNFVPDAAVALLASWSQIVGAGGKLLIGVDLEKDAATLEAAYDDAAGVTAAFNRNLLVRINRELGGDFDLDQFTHEARYNAERRRIEMHLVSECEQSVHVAGRTIAFAAGETIHTENSHKYSLDRFTAIAGKAGWQVDQVWTDSADLFSVQLLSVAK